MSHSLLWAKDYKLSDEVYEGLRGALHLARTRKQTFVAIPELFFSLVSEDPVFYGIDYKRAFREYANHFPERKETPPRIMAFAPRVKDIVKGAADLVPGQEIKAPTVLYHMLTSEHASSATVILQASGHNVDKLAERYMRFHEHLVGAQKTIE